MYQDFYGLRELPFELTPNPKYLYLTPTHREALSNLQYGLSSTKAVTLLLGEAGTGKTTLLRAALESDWCRQMRAVCISNPTLTRGEFIEGLARALDLSPEAAQSKTALLVELDRLVRARRAAGEATALIVDEAQSLSTELLEEIRLLANIETATEKLLPVVLVGQPELSDRLEDSELRQLKQRIALRCEVAPFKLPETAAYIARRIQTAGGQASRLFTREAVTFVHQCSRGIPRTINVMCDNALVTGFALERRPVDRALVLDVSRDFRLSEHTAGTPAAAGVEAGRKDAALAPAPAPAESGEFVAARNLMFDQIATGRRFTVFGSRRP